MSRTRARVRADACGSREGKQAKVRMGEAAMEVGVKRAHMITTKAAQPGCPGMWI